MEDSGQRADKYASSIAAFARRDPYRAERKAPTEEDSMEKIMETLRCVSCQREESVDIGPALAGDGSMELPCSHCGSRLATFTA